MTDNIRIDAIFDGAEASFPLEQNKKYLLTNDWGTHIGCFVFQGKSPASNQNGITVLNNSVPDDGHRIFIDVNHSASFQLRLANTGDPHRGFRYWQHDQEHYLFAKDEEILVSDPIIIQYTTSARTNIDVQVTICITPMAEDHAILVTYSAIPLAEAIEAERLANRNFIEKFIDSFKK